MSDYNEKDLSRLAKLRSNILSKAAEVEASEKENEQGIIGDSFDAVEQGLYGGAADIADGVRYLTGSETAGGAANFLRDKADDQIQQMSPEGRAAFQNFGIEKDDDSATGYGFKEGSNTKGFLLNALAGVGSFAPTMLPGTAIAKGIGLVGKVAGAAGKTAGVVGKGEAAAKTAEKAADIAGYGAGGSVSIGGSTANQAYQKIVDTDYDTLKDSEIFQSEYWKLRDKEGLDHEQALSKAREDIAKGIATEAAKDGAILGAISQGAIGPVFGKILRGEIGGAARSAATGTVSEGAQEMVESGGQTYASNVAVNPAVPTGSMEGVVGDALTGGLVGGPAGGVFGAVGGAGRSRLDKTKKQELPEEQSDAEKAIDDIDSQLAEIDELLGAHDELSDDEFDSLTSSRKSLLEQRDMLLADKGPDTSVDMSGTAPEPLAITDQNIVYGEKPEITKRAQRSDGLTDPYTGPQPSRKNDDPVYQEIKRKQRLLEEQEQEAKQLRDGLKARQKEENQQTQQTKLEGLESKSEVKAVKGRSVKAYTPSNKPIDLEYQVVDADDLVTSNNDDFTPNENYPQALQNRDRATDSSRDQINDIVNRIIPEKLGESGDVSTGAPIVRNGIVESGNGRSMGIRKAYGEGKAESYKQYLIDNADHFGIDKNELAQFNKPVLVRQRKTDMAPDELTNYTKDANTSEGQSLKPSEQAKSDAQRLQPEDLDMISLPDSGDISAPSNKPFVNKFLNRLTNNERAGLVGKDGSLTQTGATRLQNAIFAKAYQSDHLIDEATDSTTSDTKAITNALAIAAPEYAKLNGRMPELTETITNAVSLIKKSRRDGVNLEDLTSQFDIEKGSPVSEEIADLAHFLDNNIRSSKRMSDGLSSLAKQAASAIHSAENEGLFGETPPPTTEGLIKANDQIRQRKPETNAQTQSQGFTEDVSESNGRSEQEQQTLGRAAASGTGSVEAGNGTEQQTVKVNKNNKPFSSEKVARISKTFKETPNAKVVSIDGGFGVIEGVDLQPESPTSVPDTSNPQPVPADKGLIFQGKSYPEIQHTTKKNNELSGIVVPGISREEAKAIDPYTFKKGDGYFIRKDKVEAANSLEPKATPEPVDTPLSKGDAESAPKAEVTRTVTPIKAEALESFKTANEALSWLQSSAKNETVKTIARALNGKIDEGVEFSFYPGVDARENGSFTFKEKGGVPTSKGEVTIYKKGQHEETLLHELIHAATTFSIRNPNEAQQKIVDEIKSLQSEFYDKAIASESVTDEEKKRVRAAGHSVDEFVTYALTNSLYQSAMTKVKTTSGKTVFNQFAKTLKNLLGIKSETDTLSKAIALSTELIDSVGVQKEASTKEKPNSKPKQESQDKPADQSKEDAKPKEDKLDKIQDTISKAKTEKALKLKALLARKGQLNSGIDPEVMVAVAEVGALSVADGAVRFTRWVRDVLRTTRSVGIEDKSVTHFLKESYAAISANPEKYGISEEVADQMDSPRDIRKIDIDSIADEKTGEQALSDFLNEQADSITDNNKLKAVIAEYKGVSKKEITDKDLKEGQEALEVVLVNKARSVVDKGLDDKATFDELLELYKKQPNLDVRSSTSMENQAYSTPAPLAYIASRLASIDKNTTVYEPTAGNGMLVIGASKENTFVNELNGERAENLEGQGFEVTKNDATEFVPKAKTDAVIMNPPFAKIPKTDFDGYVIRAVDHLITANSLSAMKDDGKASIIIGASKEAGEIKPAERPFFNWLYSNYNVKDHFEVDGKLYNRQGAAWPVRIITVDGRRQSETLAPKSGSIERVNSWEQLYERFDESVGTEGSVASEESGANNAGKGDAQNDTGRSRQSGDSIVSTDQSSKRGGQGTATANTRSGRVDDKRDGGGSSEPHSPVGQRKPDADAGRDTIPAGEANNAGSAGGKTNERGDLGGSTAKRTGPVEDKSEYQAEYQTLSKGSNEAVLTPSNMSDSTYKSLSEISDEVGGIDNYVKEQLGYDSIDDVHKSFMGLQSDTIAAAIYNAETKNKGIIIADQTGVGKGRQAAGIIRYAIKSGKTPIFITVKDNLFTDMYNDLQDIGSHDVSPFILNQDGAINSDGRKLFKNQSRQKHKAIMEEIYRTGKLPEGSNALFLTYSQVNTANLQRGVLSALKDNAYFVMDESHNASGDRERFSKNKGVTATGAGFLYSAIKDRPVTYLSATYAKRPDNMPIYYRTDIADAVDSIDDLVDAVALGGEQLQTIMAGMLAESGQLFRRERSFKGIEVKTTIDTDNTENHTRLSNQITEGLRSIVDADRLFHTIEVKNLNKILQDQGKSASGGGNKAAGSVDHTNFTSIVHNFISQLLLGMKVEKTYDEALKAYRQGEKPVIALQNTMGSFLKGYIEENNLAVGDRIDATYKDVLGKALERTRKIKIKDEKGQERTENVPLKDLGSATRYAYKKAQSVIDELDIDDIPLSPIDYVRDKLEKAGIKTAEITGRDYIVDYSGDYPVVAKRDSSEVSDRRGTVDKFNGGELGALILNSAGSTGLSIHASSKFKDQSPRHMIVMQAMADINIFMQMLGRINRTGQVVLPKYTMLGVNIPAEKRPLAKTSRKMKSLNANTSANTESDTSIDAPDILNKYGDQIVAAYLTENREAANETGMGGEDSGAGMAEKFTGRLALLPVQRQIEIYDEIEGLYNDHIDYLNKVNQNDLNPKVIDLDAKIKDTAVIYEGKAPETVFGGNTYMHRVDAKYQGKPPTAKEVIKVLESAKDGDIVAREIEQAKESEDYIGKFDEEKETALRKIDQEISKEIEKDGLFAANADEAVASARAQDDEKLTRKYEKLIEKMESTEARYSDIKRGELITAKRQNKSMLERFKIGNRVVLNLDGETASAVVVNVRDSHKKGKGNPWALSKTKVTFMVNNGIRQIELPFSKLATSNGIYLESLRGKGIEGLGDVFDMGDLMESRREDRYIATGNLIQGSSSLSQGRIVSFKDSNGETHQGILMPRAFDKKEFDQMKKGSTFVLREPDLIAKMLKANSKVAIFNSDQSVKVESASTDKWDIIVPKANKNNEVKRVKFDKELRDLIGSDFYGKAKYMKATIDGSKLQKVMSRLIELSPMYAMPHNRADWVAVGGREAPKAEDPNLSIKGAREGGGMKASDLKESLLPLAEKFGEGDNFFVVQSIRDLPLNVRLQVRSNLEKSKGKSPVVRGVNSGNKNYIIADGIKSEKEAAQIFLHEVIGHKAVLSMLGKEGDSIMERIAYSYGPKKLEPLIRAYGADFKTKKGRTLLGKEKVAEMAEKNEKPTMLKKLVAKVRQWLRKVYPSLKWSDNDIHSLLSDAKKNAGSKKMMSADLNDDALLSIKTDIPDDIAEIINDTQAKPKSQETLLDKAKEYVEKLKKIDLVAIKQGLIDSYASIEDLEKKANLGELLDGQESAYKASLRTANLDSVMEVMMRKGALELKDGAFQVKKGSKGLLEIFQNIASKGQLPLWETWAGAIRAERIMREDAEANDVGVAELQKYRSMAAKLRKTTPAEYKGGLAGWKEGMKTATEGMNRAKAMAVQKRERNYTAAQIKKIKAHVASDQELNAAFTKAKREWADFNRAVLDMAEQSGLLDPEARKVWANDDYVPFHRVSEMEEDAPSTLFKKKKGLSGQKSGVQQLKGGVEKLNILESMVRNTTHMVDASFKNIAMQRIVDIADGVAMEKIPASKMDIETAKEMLVEMGYNPDTMDDDTLKAWGNQLDRYQSAGKGTVSVSVNGKAERYHVTDPTLYAAITQLGPMRVSGIMKIFQVPKRILTTMVTASPGFMGANFIRDSLSTWVTVNPKTTPFYDAIKGAAKSMKHSDSQWAMMAAGSGGGGYYDTTASSVREHLSPLQKGGALHKPKQAWDAWMRVGHASENANRIAVYESVINSGGSVAEAAHEAQDVINFSKRGQWPAVQALITMVPFMNARIQGLERLYRGAKENPASFFMKGSIIMAAGLALLAANWDNEEYWDLKEWDRDANWHVFVDGHHFKIPKPFEVGAFFGTVPERAFEQLRKDADGKLLGERALSMVLNTFAFDLTPQLFKPALDVAKNENSFTGSPILSMGDQYRMPNGQYSPWTSETMKQVSKAMPKGAPEWMRSPKRLEYLFKGYFGTLGGFALSLSDVVVETAVGVPTKPTKNVSQIPVLKRFYKDGVESSKHTGRFYEMLKEVNSLTVEIKSKMKEHEAQEAKDLKMSNLKKLQIRSHLNRTAKQLSALSSKIKAVYTDAEMTADQKRDLIDKLSKRRNELATDDSLRYYSLFR